MTDNDKTIIEPSLETRDLRCPMPGCGGECKVYLTLDKTGGKQRGVHCTKCRYMSPTSGKFPDKAIAAHNQLCKLVVYGQRAIAACEKPPEIEEVEPEIILKQLTPFTKIAFKAGVNTVLDLLQPPTEVPGE